MRGTSGAAIALSIALSGIALIDASACSATNGACGQPLGGCSSGETPARLQSGCCEVSACGSGSASDSVCADSCGNGWFEFEGKEYGPCPSGNDACLTAAATGVVSACDGTADSGTGTGSGSGSGSGSGGGTGCSLGSVWNETEGGTCASTWTRQGTSSTFVDSAPVCGINATLTITITGSRVSVSRVDTSDTKQCTYTGTFNTACSSVTGTYACNQGSGAVLNWSATIQP